MPWRKKLKELLSAIKAKPSSFIQLVRMTQDRIRRRLSAFRAFRLAERFWRGGLISVILKALAILASVLLFYWHDIEAVAGDNLVSKVMSYIIVIPFFIAYSLYRKRKMLEATTSIENLGKDGGIDVISGLSLYPPAFALYFYALYSPHPIEIRLLSMLIFLVGAIILAFNWQTIRQLLFPMAILLLLDPFPILIANIVGTQLSTVCSVVAYDIVKILGVPATLIRGETPIIMAQTPQGSQLPFIIDASNSGLYLMISYATFAVFAAFITRGPAWRRATLFSLGLPLVYGLNIFKISSIILIGHGLGERAAIAAFDYLEGYVLVFVAIVLLLIIGVKMLGLSIFTKGVDVDRCPFCDIAKGRFCTYCGRFLKPQMQGITRGDAIRLALIAGIALLAIPIEIRPFTLESIKAWTLIQGYLLQLAGYIFVLSAMPCSIIVVSIYLRTITDGKINAELFKRLRSTQDRGMLEALSLIHVRSPTGIEINGRTRAKLEPEDLIKTLKEAADLKLIKGEIANRDDEPVLVWKRMFSKDAFKGLNEIWGKLSSIIAFFRKKIMGWIFHEKQMGGAAPDHAKKPS